MVDADLVLKDRIVVYDLGGQRIGWANYDYTSSVNVSTSSTGGRSEYVNAGQIGGSEKCFLPSFNAFVSFLQVVFLRKYNVGELTALLTTDLCSFKNIVSENISRDRVLRALIEAMTNTDAAAISAGPQLPASVDKVIDFMIGLHACIYEPNFKKMTNSSTENQIEVGKIKLETWATYLLSGLS
ncbi:Aspartic peptidase [Artemisia annua]|uniref:Aspartic peptidase n=1 Tax=Artemisia annua TaxID=35608 RepID=A0A2U1PBD9_ARTAN|nr:Aspartic peptidase [Artemisia annua]